MVLLLLYLGLLPPQSKATLGYLCIKGMNATGPHLQVTGLGRSNS